MSQLNSAVFPESMTGPSEAIISDKLPNTSTPKSIQHEKSYCVLQFLDEDEGDVFATAPLKWVINDESECYWPIKNSTKYIKKNEAPNINWPKYKIKIITKYDTFDQALKKERKMFNESTDTQTETEMSNELSNRKKRKVSCPLFTESQKLSPIQSQACVSSDGCGASSSSDQDNMDVFPTLNQYAPVSPRVASISPRLAKQNIPLKDLKIIQLFKESVIKTYTSTTDAVFEECMKDWFRHGNQRHLRDQAKFNATT